MPNISFFIGSTDDWLSLNHRIWGLSTSLRYFQVTLGSKNQGALCLLKRPKSTNSAVDRICQVETGPVLEHDVRFLMVPLKLRSWNHRQHPVDLSHWTFPPTFICYGDGDWKFLEICHQRCVENWVYRNHRVEKPQSRPMVNSSFWGSSVSQNAAISGAEWLQAFLLMMEFDHRPFWGEMARILFRHHKSWSWK